MSGATPHLMTTDEIATRILLADLVAMRNARSFSGNVNRPVGVQIFASITVQDARRAIGLGLPLNALAQYQFGR